MSSETCCDSLFVNKPLQHVFFVSLSLWFLKSTNLASLYQSRSTKWLAYLLTGSNADRLPPSIIVDHYPS